MTDKELLELAAKAAGINAQWDCPERGMMMLTPDGTDTMTWNPLTDDGDALRLAVKLDLFYEHAGFTYELAVQANIISDQNAATRRAIVLTSAEMANGMKE